MILSGTCAIVVMQLLNNRIIDCKVFDVALCQLLII